MGAGPWTVFGVTRTEFQMRSNFLKEFNVTTFESFEKSLGDIFRDLTQKSGLTLREPSGGKRLKMAYNSFGLKYKHQSIASGKYTVWKGEE